MCSDICLSAWDACRLAIERKIDGPSLLRTIVTEISKEAREGNFQCACYTGGHYLENAEVEFLESLGYVIVWNSAQESYIIKWEHLEKEVE